MYSLSIVSGFMQTMAKAIASIIGIEVTILDSDCVRVAGTGIYSQQLGEAVPHESFFNSVLINKKPGLIADVNKEYSCTICSKRDVCLELASLAFPIVDTDQTLGLIAIVAFTEEQREYLLREHSKLEEFLKHMSILLKDKIKTSIKTISLEKQIADILERSDGIFDNIIGDSPDMKSVINIAKRVAGSTSSVLILGESGTGKEILAKSIHSASDRANNLLITVNCASIPDSLVESELFGYEDGAFTGAKKGGKVGKFELAHNSTIFLDEIGDMPLMTQAKLLRVLQEGKVDKVGGKRPIPIDVRIICATHWNLAKMVEEGKFREDLYYRINVIPLTLPPLRDRRGDISMLVCHFIDHYSKRLRKPDVSIETAALKALEQYDWPGNIRELKNIIEYLLNIVDSNTICMNHLPTQFHTNIQTMYENRTLQQLIQDYERDIYSKYFKSGLSVQEKNSVAKNLGVSIATAYRKLQQYGIG